MRDQINTKKLFTAGKALRRIGAAMILQFCSALVYLVLAFGGDTEVVPALGIVLVLVVFISSIIIIVALFNAGESLIEASGIRNFMPISEDSKPGNDPMKTKSVDEKQHEAGE